MVVGEIAEPVDLLVVGGGPGGYTAAERAAELGRRVVLVDQDGREGGLGGSCLHVGCIPSKALIELASAFERTTSLASAGLTVAGAEVDLAAFQNWKQSIISRLEGGVRGLLKRHDVTVLNGRLRFNALNRAAVTTDSGVARFLEFKQAIIATGSSPAWPAALRPDGEQILSSTDVLALDELPPTLTVVGAGYIGLELGMAFAKLGTSVTVVELADNILPGVDARLTRPVRRALDRLGVNVVVGTRVIGHDDEGLAVERRNGRVADSGGAHTRRRRASAQHRGARARTAGRCRGRERLHAGRRTHASRRPTSRRSETSRRARCWRTARALKAGLAPRRFAG